jgi:outer membrane protein OmpA-like peptidoglycan-associated protein
MQGGMASAARTLLPLVTALALGLTACAGSDAELRAQVPRPDERFVFFGAGSAQISTNDGFFSLGYVVAMLDVEPRFQVLVVGHADPSGTPEANQRISFQRARAVRQVLLDHGVSAKRILIGARKKATSQTDALLSRRADIYVYDPVEEEVSHRLGYEVELRSE